MSKSEGGRPRTDAMWSEPGMLYEVSTATGWVKFARTLERELTAAQASLKLTQDNLAACIARELGAQARIADLESEPFLDFMVQIQHAQHDQIIAMKARIATLDAALMQSEGRVAELEAERDAAQKIVEGYEQLQFNLRRRDKGRADELAEKLAQQHGKTAEQFDRAESAALHAAELSAENVALRQSIAQVEKDARRYHWLRDKSEPGICAFYLSVGEAFHKIRFKPETVDDAIDAQMIGATAP